MKRILFSVFLLTTALLASSQIVEPVKWNFSQNKISDNEFELVFTAIIEEGWHMYSTDLPEGGPIKTSFYFENVENAELAGEPTPNKEVVEEFDNSFQMDLRWFEEEVSFTQKVKVTGTGTVVGYVEFMSCDDETCTPPMEAEFSFELTGGAQQTAAAETTDDSSNRNYWSIFFLAFLGGFAALLTPCVFPMIPMTVSFFTKQSKTKAKGIRNGIWYGISIILIYVILGTVVTAVFGAESLNSLSTNPWFNLFFALLLFVFAFSFMGAFEIVLPSSWVNAVDKKADKGGLLGIFFMAFALALVSFSCTGPIVGALIVEAARSGGLAPVVGMLGFSLALAIPFALFAAFPGWLNSLPKSGGWLNSVKVVLGFLEFAFAFKFLSIADMVLDLHILEREVYIAIWIAIFMGLALYLWGKIKLPHDSPTTHLPVSRFVLGTMVFAFVIYMIPGLWGAPVKLISGFPPPVDYAESPLGVGRTQPAGAVATGHSSGTMASGMHIGPHGIPLFDDYDKALAHARETGKPLLIDFTGKGCTNCRKMEDNVWVKQEVKNKFLEDYVVVSLYVDLKTKLPEEEQYVSETTGRKVRSVGNKWTDFQISRFHRNTQPYYVILDENENQIGEGYSYDPDPEDFIEWLNEGLTKFKK
ncbi:Thiol:disulfide interchange protein DsbD [Draconibacterium orientale]|uniref:Thiol:disulfide interchange protein DsbD n=1 Tax=Draconibacterium orientale TaxID=1168034 RepID=X5DH28_9BACT|nr:cytochrome c biogenesis protein CcdA [Draconibacterium orientale]AHW60379.1 thiol:disulfide interchange protein DsbD [Draconibacterium orientale]SET81285.1 Thiol:disulfide interchange protein DsbD [Draconibacterium orientale]